MGKVLYEIVKREADEERYFVISELILSGYLSGYVTPYVLVYGRYLTNKTTLKKLLERSK